MNKMINSPESKEELANKEYTCTKCQSEIEILLIDNKNMKILFHCSNKDEKKNHGVNNMLIRNYIKSILKNTISAQFAIYAKMIKLI